MPIPSKPGHDKTKQPLTRQDRIQAWARTEQNRTEQDTVGVYICAQVMDNDML